MKHILWAVFFVLGYEGLAAGLGKVSWLSGGIRQGMLLVLVLLVYSLKGGLCECFQRENRTGRILKAALIGAAVGTLGQMYAVFAGLDPMVLPLPVLLLGALSE